MHRRSAANRPNHQADIRASTSAEHRSILDYLRRYLGMARTRKLVMSSEVETSRFRVPSKEGFLGRLDMAIEDTRSMGIHSGVLEFSRTYELLSVDELKCNNILWPCWETAIVIVASDYRGNRGLVLDRTDGGVRSAGPIDPSPNRGLRRPAHARLPADSIAIAAAGR